MLFASGIFTSLQLMDRYKIDVTVMIENEQVIGLGILV